MELEVGMLVESRAGHDKGSLYVVMEMEGPYLFLCDGRLRTVGRPKKKKKMHVAKKAGVPEKLLSKQVEGQPWTDEDIKRVIKIWRSEHVEG